MHLKKLSLLNFKNYHEADIELSDGINCFIGNNGGGKTNILDAIYYLSFSKSFFNSIDSQNILHNEAYFFIQGTFEKNGETDVVSCGLKRGEKKQMKRNKKNYTRLADHIGLYPLVIISPSDSELITEGSDERRKFVDGVISQFDTGYLSDLLNYNKVLMQRNILLKSFYETGKRDYDSLGAWDFQLMEFGSRVFEKRKDFLKSFNELFQLSFELISGGKEKVSLEYQSQLYDTDFESLLKNNLKNDLARQHSTAGIHKDDLIFNIGGFPLKKFGSQGQQKSYLTSLKFAQYEYIKNIKKLKPLLLLDDIFDKLDKNRVKSIINIVATENFKQIFITDTDRDRIEVLLPEIGKTYKIFHVKGGKVK